MGNIDGDFDELNSLINKRIRMDKTFRATAPRWKASGNDLQFLILQCGNFAYFWPYCDSGEAIRTQIDFLPSGRVPIYWTGGNHEGWTA